MINSIYLFNYKNNKYFKYFVININNILYTINFPISFKTNINNSINIYIELLDDDYILNILSCKKITMIDFLNSDNFLSKLIQTVHYDNISFSDLQTDKEYFKTNLKNYILKEKRKTKINIFYD